MKPLETNLNELVELARHPRRTILSQMQATGKKSIGCLPVNVPEEIIYAAGFLPVGLWGGQIPIQKADSFMQSYCCAIIRADLEYAINGNYNLLSGLVQTGFCDTLKCASLDFEVILPNMPMLPMIYPHNRALPEAMEYMMEEMEAFKRRLEELAGHKVSEADLEAALAVYDDYRAAMGEFVQAARDYPITINAKVRHLVIKAAWFMDKKLYTEKIKEITKQLKAMPKEEFKGIRAVVTGIMVEPEGLLDIFVDNNIAFVADDLAQESRQFRTATSGTGPVIKRLAQRVMDMQGGCLLFDCGRSKGEFLAKLMDSSKADALIVCMTKFCDPEGMDYPRYKAELEAKGVKLIYLETEQQMDSMENLRTRIQSFAEMF